jgi:hypothetical protein
MSERAGWSRMAEPSKAIIDDALLQALARQAEEQTLLRRVGVLPLAAEKRALAKERAAEPVDQRQSARALGLGRTQEVDRQASRG